MFSSTFYDKLDPKYREKLLQIERLFQIAKPFFESPSSLHTGPKIQNFKNATFDFHNRYMMPKELWEIILKINHIDSFGYIDNCLESSKYQFQYKPSTMTTRCNFGKKLYNDILRIKFKATDNDEDFCYPHTDMDNSLKDYERNQCSFVPKSVLRNFERMKLQYDKIKAVEEDYEKWLEAILEVNDEEFIEHNIEFRLGQDLTNKDLWKFFLGYFKSHDQQKLLQTYSKYCRFFLDDTEMFEEYENAAGDQKVRVPWKNVFEFEIYDAKCYRRQHEDERNYSGVQKAPLQCHFNAENALNQKFPFKSNLMHYIVKNASACVLHDLFKSCKWFYLKNPVTICYKCLTGNSTHINIRDQSIFAYDFSSFSPLFEKLFISMNLYIDESLSSSTGLISWIYRCTPKYVTIYDQKFTDEELQILIGYGNVEELSFDNVKNTNSEYFKLENILEMVPKIKSLNIRGIQCTSETSRKLCDLKFENKMQRVYLNEIQNDLLDPRAFAEFINKNVSPKTDVQMSFISIKFAESFFSIVETAINKYWDAESKPKFFSYF